MNRMIGEFIKRILGEIGRILTEIERVLGVIKKIIERVWGINNEKNFRNLEFYWKS